MLFWCRNKRVVNIPTEILLITPVYLFDLSPPRTAVRHTTFEWATTERHAPWMYVVCTSWTVSQIRKFSIRRSIRYNYFTSFTVTVLSRVSQWQYFMFSTLYIRVYSNQLSWSSEQVLYMRPIICFIQQLLLVFNSFHVIFVHYYCCSDHVRNIAHIVIQCFIIPSKSWTKTLTVPQSNKDTI